MNMIQKTGNTSQTEAKLVGQERIYSQGDTQAMVDQATNSSSREDFIALGKFVYDATKKQDSRDPEIKFE